MVVTWVIMAVLLVLSLILVRNLKVENPGKKQLLLEAGVDFLRRFSGGSSEKTENAISRI